MDLFGEPADLRELVADDGQVVMVHGAEHL
jgi:hypothetical protein